MLNHVAIQGRMVADPELKDTNSGTKVVNFRLAWSEKFKDRETKLFLECKAFGGLAEHVCKYFTKGQETVVEGKLNTEEWKSKEGENRSKIVLVLSGINFCGKKQDGAVQTQDVGGFPEVEADRLPF